MIRRTRASGDEFHLGVAHHTINGGGPLVVFVHATGFCKETWDPVLAELAALGSDLDAIVVDQRAHGASGGGGTTFAWSELGSDVNAVLDGRVCRLGVGHSSGGATLVFAELAEPATFESLLLIEPILPPPPFDRQPDHPLVKGAARRTPSFTSRRQAANHYRERGPFKGWDERAFLGYLAGGLLDDPDGGVRLACAPRDEAEFYSSAFAHGGYSRLGELTLPVEVMVGEGTDAFGVDFFSDIAAQIPQSILTVVPGGNHFIPMQQPELVAAAIAATLD